MTRSDRPWPSDAQAALGVVGVDLDELRRVVRDEVGTAEHAYLVGSLASGWGNAASDIDVHVVLPGLNGHTSAPSRHVGATTVDIETYPAAWGEDVVAEISCQGLVNTQLGPLPRSRRTGAVRRWPDRWVHALPLAPAGEPLFDERERRLVRAMSVRAALDEMLIAASVARLLDLVQVPASVCRWAWGRAARMLIEAKCRAAGDLTTTEKWLPARAVRCGIVNVAATDETSFCAAAADAGFADIDPWEICRVRAADDAEVVRLAGRQWLHTRHGRLLDQWRSARDSVADTVADLGPQAVLNAVRQAAATLDVDDAALTAALEGRRGSRRPPGTAGERRTLDTSTTVGPGDEGHDLDWVLTHGAAMAWIHTRRVQPALVDLHAALALSDWPLAVESAAATLRAILACGWTGAGLRGRMPRDETTVRLAVDHHPAAAGLRGLAWSGTASAEDARSAAATAIAADSALRTQLPFVMPDIRSADGSRASMRLAADLNRWRRERGHGPLDWEPEEY